MPRALGLEPGGRLGLFPPNCAEFVIAFHAASKLGAIVCPLNSSYRNADTVGELDDGRDSHKIGSGGKLTNDNDPNKSGHVPQKRDPQLKHAKRTLLAPLGVAPAKVVTFYK